MPNERGPLAELVVEGEAGKAFYSLLYELSASALRRRQGQPSDAEIRELAHESVLVPQLLDKLALLASEKELRAVLRTAVDNHLVSGWRATHRGRVRRRVADVLDAGCSELVETPLWGVAGWAWPDADAPATVSDLDPAPLAARLPRLDITWANWESESGRDPIADRDELCRLIMAIVEVAGGSAPLWVIAEAVRLAAGLPDDGQILGWATERMADPDVETGWVAVASGEVLQALVDDTLEWLCALLDELPVRELAAQTGMSKSTVARRLNDARADVAEALDGHDACGTILLYIYSTRCGTPPEGSAFRD